MISIIGVPLDESSTYLRGCAQAPPAIRAAFRCASTNTSTEDGIDLNDHPKICDAGDLSLESGQAALQQIESAVGDKLAAEHRVLALGGDHSITYPILRAYGARYGQLKVIQFDAHPDLYDEFGGERFSHASPFARACEEGLIERLVQIGIRAMNAEQRAQAERFGVEVIRMQNWPKTSRVDIAGPLYVTLDLDVLDPGCAPGISHYEPGGATVRQVLDVIQNLNAEIIGADIVELNPTRDSQNMTAMVAAKFMKEILAAMLRSIA